MAKSADPVTIKKYANRRLYNTGTSTYVTLEDLASMVKGGEDFLVFDAKSGEDITRSVLTQIIFEQEGKDGQQNLLPVTFLRQLIRFYGDSMGMLVPRFLEVSIDSLTREQEQFRSQMTQAFGVGPFGALEDQARRNMEAFQRAFSVFAPFGRQIGQGPAAGHVAGQGGMPQAGTAPPGAPAAPERPRAPGELDELKRQLAEMQKRLDQLSAPEKKGGSGG